MSPRKRATHYALMDAAFAADRKFIRLARVAPDAKDYAAAVGVFWLILADCRRSKDPEVDWEEYGEYVEQIRILKEVGLLNDTGFPPEPFEKWAPAYKSPWDAGRTGTQGNGGVRNGTQGNDISVQFSSIPFSSTEGGVGGTAPETFMGFRPKKPKPGEHLGQHPDCSVCAPLRKPKDAA